MKNNSLERATLLLVFSIVGSWLLCPVAFAAPTNSALLKAKQESEAKGLIFINSHNEIVDNARKEGKLHAVLNLEPASINAILAAFKKEYPFLDVFIEEVYGLDVHRRFILELKTGRPTRRDTAHLSTAMYQEYLPFMKKYDLLNMAKHGVINVPVGVMDKVNPYIISVTCNMQVAAYNKNLISHENVPGTWEDFLKPQFKGKKFVVDIRPKDLAALVPAWGLEKVIDFAHKIANQEPIWTRGGTRTLTAMSVGEYALFMGPNYSSTMRAIAQDPTKSLGVSILEPVPVRPADNIGILAQSKHPHVALLWLEFLASPKVQKIVDEFEPYNASVFFSGGFVNKATKGKKVSMVTWRTEQKLPEYEQKIIEAYGFPKSEIRKKKKKK